MVTCLKVAMLSVRCLTVLIMACLPDVWKPNFKVVRSFTLTLVQVFLDCCRAFQFTILQVNVHWESWGPRLLGLFCGPHLLGLGASHPKELSLHFRTMVETGTVDMVHVGNWQPDPSEAPRVEGVELFRASKVVHVPPMSFFLKWHYINKCQITLTVTKDLIL